MMYSGVAASHLRRARGGAQWQGHNGISLCACSVQGTMALEADMGTAAPGNKSGSASAAKPNLHSAKALCRSDSITLIGRLS